MQRCWPRATPDFGSLSVISSFLQDIPRHDARFFEVREAFKRTLMLRFRAYISEYIAKKKKASGGPPGGAQHALRRLLRSPQPPINARVHTTTLCDEFPRRDFLENKGKGACGNILARPFHGCIARKFAPSALSRKSDEKDRGTAFLCVRVVFWSRVMC